jgi:hypothetical protein
LDLFYGQKISKWKLERYIRSRLGVLSNSIFPHYQRKSVFRIYQIEYSTHSFAIKTILRAIPKMKFLALLAFALAGIAAATPAAEPEVAERE